MATRGRRKSTSTLLERLLNKVIIDKNTDCWEWQGGKNNIGYGMIRDEDKMRTTHRVSYEEHNDTIIPKGKVVMHTCDNRSCVNPDHLIQGTQQQNMRDMVNKGRSLSGMSGRQHVKMQCVYCLKTIAKNVHNRCHGDKCKHKQ